MEETATPNQMMNSISGQLEEPKADPQKSLKADVRAAAKRKSQRQPNMGEMSLERPNKGAGKEWKRPRHRVRC